ncbi:unnamed protein product [Anisakis simplex]|uniref:DB domain-containing protein n=1 Tax=Anisakis simplex TaxID=6269 RepID=A0A0M3JSM8_ANISI|nr:unnamed protein product [Anisakis simplex]
MEINVMSSTRYSCICVMFLGLIVASEGCLSTGICGGGFGCAPPMAPPVCMGGCGAGYGCGRFGCYARARARSAKTFNGDKDDVQETIDQKKWVGAFQMDQKQLLTPDEKFHSCCVDRQLPDAMYFGMDACPIQAATDLHFCAAQGRDHRQCCQENSVTSTLAGEKCLVFCDQRPGNITKLDMTYLACYERFENIKGCFWHDLKEKHASEPPVRFDSF